VTTLEERIAEAIKGAIPKWETRMYDDDAEAAARAVVAVLPTADVSDADLAEAVHGMHPVTTVKALLDAQAAAHAAEVRRLTADNQHLRAVAEGWRLADQASEARAEVAEAQVAAVTALCDAQDARHAETWAGASMVSTPKVRNAIASARGVG
jgi:hypothetical protein